MSGKYKWLLLGALVASFAGCGLPEWVHNGFKVGPNYGPPPVPVAPTWIDYCDPRVKSVPADLACWWNVFHDPVLTSLVQTAPLQNISLRAAGMRIMEARYRRQIAVGTLFPQLQQAEGSYSRNKVSANIANAAPDLWFSNWETGMAASWELDFWGRFRRAIEAANADLDASVADYDNVLVLLLAEAASAYVDVRSFQERLRFAHENVDAQEKALAIAEDKFRHDTATRRDVEQARTVLEQTRALVPLFESSVRLANNRLCVVLGMPPRDLAAQLEKKPIPEAPLDVAIGIPADLIRRRPDVRQAERQVAAQCARIGIAKSGLYPHFTINGTFGVAAEQFSQLFDSNRSTFGSIGPAFRWDVLNYGRIVSNVGLQDARCQELVFICQQTVLDAGREAEDGIITFLKSKERTLHVAESAKAAQATLKITVDQYKQGIVDFTAVFLAASELAQRDDQWAEAQGTEAQSLIQLYKALGGGWQMRLGPMAPAPGPISGPMPGPRAEPVPAPPALPHEAPALPFPPPPTERM